MTTVASPARDVILQAFYWDVPKDPPWWTVLAGEAKDFAGAGFGALWLPPPYKGGAGVNDVGYGVYDRYDLGEFLQKGTTRTRYGTRQELDAAVLALHAEKIAVYADIVMNHMMGADGTESVVINGKSTKVWSRFDHAGRAGALSGFQWSSARFNGCEQSGWKQWAAWDFQPYYGGDAWDNLLGCEIRYADPAVQDELIAWGKWITEVLALDGYRLDATKHISTPFITRWLAEVKGERFAVSEAWLGNLDHLKDYAQRTAAKTKLFDVPLHYLFSEMSQKNGGFDLRRLKNAGFTAARPELSVTFVDNHDTVKAGGLYSPVERFTLSAYAYILLRQGGVPSVFYKDYAAHKDALKTLIGLRTTHARGKEREHNETAPDLYVYSREGEAGAGGLTLMLNDASADFAGDVVTPFVNARLKDAISGAAATSDASGKARLGVKGGSYAVWLPET